MFFFFFQAEDGIRDGHVTGVQTCALPISQLSCAPTWPPGSRRRAAWAAVAPGAPAAPAGAPETPHASVSGPAGRATTSLTAAASPEPSARRTRTLTAPEHPAPGEIPAPPHDPERSEERRVANA